MIFNIAVVEDEEAESDGRGGQLSRAPYRQYPAQYRSEGS